MRLVACGVLTDYQGRVFLQQSDPRTLRPIHQIMAAGQTPALAIDRAFREQTGLIVYPVRLTVVQFDDTAGGELLFAYRCTMRGGDLVIPDSMPPAGFFDCPPLPDGLERRFRRLTDAALHHPGGPPNLIESGGLSSRLGRLIGRREDDAPGPDWDISVRLEAGAPREVVECVVGELDAAGTTAVEPATPPWRTAERLLGADNRLVYLSRVELDVVKTNLTLVFAPSDVG